MNNDLISRSELKKVIDTIKQIGYDTENKPLFDYVELPDLIKVIDTAPTVDAQTSDAIQYTLGYQDGFLEGKKICERPRGEWIVDEDNDILRFMKCSNCGEGAEWLDGGSQFLSKFCPNCGADMRGEE